MKKVLVISYHFPPVNSITARQWQGTVSYMPKFGWEPIVLTTNSRGDLQVRTPENHIIRIGENYHSSKGLVSEEGYRGIPLVLKPFYLIARNMAPSVMLPEVSHCFIALTGHNKPCLP